MRVAICDDSQDFLLQSKNTLQQWPDQPVNMTVETFDDSYALIQAHNSSPFDIILLDIVMPLVNGMEAAREIRQSDKTVKIVFLTSSPDFAIDSYEVKASNYLLKPLDSQKLFHCLDDIVEELQRNARSITVRCLSSTHRIELQNIEYIEAQNKHTLFVFADGSTIDAIHLMYTYENQLSLEDGFFKCHRSYVVNLHHVASYSNKEIQTRSGHRIPISRNYQQDFKNAYFSVIFGKAGD